MFKEQLIECWKKEEIEPFTGWDFSYLEGRMLEEQPPWSYKMRAAELMRAARAVLDMGTGGGEVLLSLQEYWPEKLVVTEDYVPNYVLSKERLEPLGVMVADVPLTRDGLMPFSDGEFDLILNRHSGLNCTELGRILAPGGIFLTQQIHGLWAEDLLGVFGMQPQWEDAAPKYYVPRLQRAGLVIVQASEWQGKLEFVDVGAVVYYLKAVPWLVPGFSVTTHLESLLRLEQCLREEGELVFTARKYLIEAYKEGDGSRK